MRCRGLVIGLGWTCAVVTALGLAPGGVAAQQIADTTFAPAIAHPAAAPGAGPVVLLDEAHGNFHTAGGRYRPFAEFLRRDGYDVRASAELFTAATLRQGRILVIANPLAAVNQSNWALPTPSAFSDSEVAAVHAWVEDGGSLLLIVDHMPFPGAVQNLAAAFGVRWNNGFAVARDAKQQAPFVFRRSDGSLAGHPITNGASAAERVDSVATFTGSAFEAPGADPLLVLPRGIESLQPQVAWQFAADTPRTDVAGWPQAAALRVGKGRVFLCGEAAMFSAQVTGPNRVPMGMNAPVAAQNPQFLLNLFHWLSGWLDAPAAGTATRH